jgi:hypothetical protein
MSCNLNSIWVYVRKIYTMIINRSLTMIISCNKLVNFNYVAIGVALALSEQLLCNWCITLMHIIMPHVWLGKGP